jgi:hypothetical protein
MRIGEPTAGFVPLDAQGQPMWSLIAVRWVGAALLVPVMEELFWRSFLMRWIASPRWEGVDPRAVGLRAIVLSTFVNAQGLNPLGDGQFAETPRSGLPVTGGPGSGTLGLLQSAALEEGNVDLTEALVDLITAQRNYQANAQTIKTHDQLLQTIVNLRLCPSLRLSKGGRHGPSDLYRDVGRQGDDDTPGRARQQPGQCHHTRVSCRSQRLSSGAGSGRRSDHAGAFARSHRRIRCGARAGHPDRARPRYCGQGCRLDRGPGARRQ